MHASGWQGELVQALHFSAAHLTAHTGLRKNVPTAEFLLSCFPQGASSQTLAPASAPADRLELLLSSWVTWVFPSSDLDNSSAKEILTVGFRRVPLLLGQWTESCVGSALLLSGLQRSERSLMFQKGGARQAWCKEEKVVA